jgi:hypothetical protein
MKKLIVLLFIGLAVLMVGCGSDPEPMAVEEPEDTIVVESQVFPPKVIEHKSSAFGGSVPEWVFIEPMELEKTEEYADSYVFLFDSSGENLEFLKAWASGFEASQSVARMVSTRVKSKFVGAQVGDDETLEKYMENVVKTMSEAQFSGARKAGDFWVFQQYFNDDGTADYKQYRYLLLYVVPRDQVTDAIERALEGANAANKPKTEEEVTARERVKELYSEGL